MLKQTLGWTTPRLRDPAAADRWTWLVITAHTQLRLARHLTDDLRRPWERPTQPGRLTPARVRRGFRNFHPKTTHPATAPKPSAPGLADLEAPKTTTEHPTPTSAKPPKGTRPSPNATTGRVKRQGVPRTLLDLRPALVEGSGSNVDAYFDLAEFPNLSAQDVPLREAKLMATEQRPLSTTAFAGETGVLGVPAWNSIPAYYMVAFDGHVIPPVSEKAMGARAAKDRTVTIHSSHAAMVSLPAPSRP